MSNHNFCPICGAKLPADARFCGACGTPIDAYEVDSRATAGSGMPQRAENDQTAKPCEGSPQLASVFSTDTAKPVGADLTAQSGSKLDAETESGAGADASTQAQSFTAAVESTVRRSRRRMPLIVLVALALALTSAVAFAAYTVYNQVIVPAMQAQQATIESQDNAQVEEEPITYSIKTETVSVTIPGDPMAKSPTQTTDEWTYDQLEPSRQSDAIDKINETIKQSVLDTAFITNDKAEQQANGATDREMFINTCIKRDIFVTHQNDSVVCFYDYSYVTGFGAHGLSERGGIAFSLETGEQVPLSSVIGIAQDSLIDLTCAAEETYIAENPNKQYWDNSKQTIEGTRKKLTESQGKLEKTTPGLEGEERFCLNEDGMFYLTANYELGSFAMGTRDICVAAFSDQSIVGTEPEGRAIKRIS